MAVEPLGKMGKRMAIPQNATIIDADLNVFRLWAYGAAVVSAMSVKKAGVSNRGFNKSNKNSTNLETLGVSQNGQELLQALLNTTFTGLSGDSRIVDGQLQSLPSNPLDCRETTDFTASKFGKAIPVMRVAVHEIGPPDAWSVSNLAVIG
ncbi:hypothetical protein U1Q18_036157 [Sarracenia purpurea var. burkii]